MFWAVVFLTLPQLISWFPSFGVPASLPNGGVGTGWMANLQSDVTNFVQNFVMKRLALTFAAFFVLRAILDTIQGGHPLPSILAAMFLLAIQTTVTSHSELQQWHFLCARPTCWTVYGTTRRGPFVPLRQD